MGGITADYPDPIKGKVRDTYILPNNERIIITTNRQSAFDRHICEVPHKGEVLTKLCKFWFDRTRDIIPNHMLDYTLPNVMGCKSLLMLPIELVVRDYMTGSTETSIWKAYEKGYRKIYGHEFPDGMRKNQKLPDTIITPTTKGVKDIPMSEEEILDLGIFPINIWTEMKEKALKLFERGKEIAESKGLILVDTKYEFGLDKNKVLTLGDEIHTPDSSRFWKLDTYQERFEQNLDPENFDKEFLRLWIVKHCQDPYNDPIPEIPFEIIDEFSRKYTDIYEQLTGKTFKPFRK